MAVNLVKGVEWMIDKGAGQFMQEVVATARGFAPVDTGHLAGSISGTKIKLGTYAVSTNASGRNGFAYPARIEFGQEVVATNGKTLHFVAHGREVYAKRAGASSQSHFVQKTISKYGGIYTGK